MDSYSKIACATTLTKNETFVLASNDITLTLPAITASDNGLSITIKNVGSHVDLVTAKGASGATIDGDTMATLTRYVAQTFVANGGNWLIKNKVNKLKNIIDVNANSSWMNVDHYEVERLNTSGNFAAIGRVKSNNSQLETEYEYIDALPLVGVAMYRIRSVDMDGQYSFSKVVSVSEKNTAGGLQVLNNPDHEAIYITVSDEYKGKYQYELFSTAGQLMQSA